jgi:hypothetical protein
VALLPDENQVNRTLQAPIVDDDKLSQYDFQMPQSMLIEMFHEIDIPTIDVLPAMRADHRCLYMNDTHWIAAGQELAASVIFEKRLPILAQTKALKRGVYISGQDILCYRDDRSSNRSSERFRS